MTGLKRMWIIVMMGLLYCFDPAFGAPSSESDTFMSFQENWSPELDIELKGAYYHKDSPLKPENFHLNGNATLQLSHELTDNMLLKIDPRANFDTLYAKGVELFLENGEDRPGVTLNQFFLSWYGDSAEVALGKKIYSWKVADGYSPLDTLNPVDVIDPTDPEKIGIPSLSILKIFESVTLQLVWLPFFSPDRQPDSDNRWVSDDPETRTEFERRFGMPPITVDAGRSLPENVFDKMSMASRISSSTLLSGWDLAAVYRYGYSSQGVLRNDVYLSSLPLVYQTTEYPAYHLYGLSFSTAFGDIEYHGEAGFHDTRDNLKDEDYLSYIGGINYTNYEWFSPWFEDILFILEYAGERITQKRDDGSFYSDKGLGRGLTDNVIASIRFKINEDHSVKTTWIHNLSDGDSLMDMVGESQLNEHLKIIYGYQRFSGDEVSFFGQWDENDRFYMRISLQY